ncbi:polyhydroxyalkanoic acid system family protein [Alsobacter sp. KACC 23698]|uniref:Polyhydroxyalkanoic acid system family protein n=1 Tax=Alsobacter sp. KACC 23698 TaxID=3149229 RepID=A0AAU7JKD3_9HYPH
MPKPVVVTISHALGREQAVERLRERIGAIRQALGQYRVVMVKDEWAGDRLNLGLSALGQTVQGIVDVKDDHVRIEVQLPWLLAAFADRLQALVREKGPALLGPPGKRD